MIRGAQVNFSKGVLSETVQGRMDVEAYNAGLRIGENIILAKQGGFSIRPGFRYVSVAGDNERLVPFQFSNTQAYALAFGNAYMQPLAGGGVVTEDELAILGISASLEAEVNIPFHSYVAGDEILIEGVTGTMANVLNGRVWTVINVTGPNHFLINATTTGMTFTGAGGGVTRVGPPVAAPAVPAAPAPYVPPEPPVVVTPGGSAPGGDRDGNWYRLQPGENYP